VRIWGIAIWFPSGATILNFSTATRAALLSEPLSPVAKDWRLFKNRVWKKILRPKKRDVTRDWRKLHNEEFHDLCLSPKWGWSNQEEQDGWGLSHVWGKGEVCTRFWWGNLRERDYFYHLGIDGRMILKWIEGRKGVDCIHLARDGEVAGCCRHGNEFTVCSKYKYTCYQNTYTIVKTTTHYKTHTYTHPHITNPTHTHTHILQNKLKQLQYKIYTK